MAKTQYVTDRKPKPKTLDQLRQVGSRQNAIQIAAPRHLYKPAYIRNAESGDHELVTSPLATPTGPGGAVGFRNRAGSQIATPHVTNVYMGTFWADQNYLEAFSKAVVEYGYLQPLADLNYGTGPGAYLGAVNGASLQAGTVFQDTDAQKAILSMLNGGVLHADSNTMFMLILPTGVASQTSDGSQSCSTYCGYHDSFNYNGVDVAYAILPSPTGCQGCGNGQIGDFTAVYSHELAEAATDKVPGKGWIADDGQENGDLEAWILFGWGPPSDPSRYTVQGYYTNERGNTVGAWSGPTS